jgi:hypothetical protein
MALTYNQISAITQVKIMPKLVDNIFAQIPLLNRLKKKESPVDGGTKVQVPLEYAQNSAGGAYSGADTLNNTDVDVITAAEFDWKQYYQSIVIKRDDELKNSGDAAILKFVTSKVKNAERSLRDTMATAAWSSGTNVKDILGLRTFLSASNTYGGISQSTYSWWAAQDDTSSTTLSFAVLQGLYGSATIDADQPTVNLTTQTLFDKYYLMLQPQQRFMDAESAKGGFRTLMFNGKPVIVDSKCPSGYWVMLNEEYLHWLPHKDENFRFEAFAKPVNQNIKIAHIFWMGVFASSNNRMHAYASGLTA